MPSLKYLVVLLVIHWSVISSCRSPQMAQQPDLKPLPETFAEAKDSLSAASIGWKQFFTDKHLADLIDTALLNNWDAQMAMQRIQAAQSDVLVAKGALYPQVNAGAAASLRKFGLYTMDGAGNITTDIIPGKIVPTNLPDYFVGLQTSWEIDLWGKLKNRKKAAIARFLSTIEGRNVITTGLIAEIALSYFDLLAFDQILNIVDETIQLQINALEIVKFQKEAAVTNELAVKQFEAQLLNFQSLRLEIIQQAAETENRINFLVGRYPQKIARDTIKSTGSLPALMTSGVPSALLQNRPDIRKAELELVAAKADVQSAKASFYPTLTINGSAGFQAFKLDLLFTTPASLAYGFFGSLAAPLINRAAIKGAFNRSNAVQLEALYNYQKSIVAGYTEVYNEILRTKNLQQVFELKKKEATTLAQAVDISNDLFRFGRANYLEVLISRQNALESKLAVVETRKNLFKTSVNLYKALGGGWR